MKKYLVVVDMQVDFVDGALGTAEAQKIVKNVCDKIKAFDGGIYVTFDTHTENYPETLEGKKLPVPHCIKGTAGWKLNDKVGTALEGREYTCVEKPIFGAAELADMLSADASGEKFTVELIGLCTDICVISNALLLRTLLPDTEIYVDASCCAGVSEKTHKAALDVMRSCLINVIGE